LYARRVAVVLDPEGAHAAAVRELAVLDGCRVLEIGCGEGRLTYALAGSARSWLATEPVEADLVVARRDVPSELAGTVRFALAGGAEVVGSPGEFDLVFFSWSL
jgi:protein-L-isoaspartate O-methyltransferase